MKVGVRPILPNGVPNPPLRYMPKKEIRWSNGVSLGKRCLYCETRVWGKCQQGVEHHVYDDDRYAAHEACRVMEVLSGKD